MHFSSRSTVFAGLILWEISLSCSVFDQVPVREQNKLQASSQELHSRPSTMPTEGHSENPLSHLKLDFGTPESDVYFASHDLTTLLDSSDSEPSDAIREISISGWAYPTDDSQLISLFKQLTNLRVVHWSAHRPIPPSILQSLEINNPSCKLQYTLYFRSQAHIYSRNRGQDTDSILNSTLLYSLKADIIYGSEENFSDLSLIFSIMNSCPNLRSLDLSIQHHGCVYAGWTPYAFDFRSNPNVKFPPLEVLKLNGYNLDEESDGGYAWYWKDSPPFDWTTHLEGDIDLPPRPIRNQSDGMTSLDCWLEAMDWSHLHTLDLSPTVATLNRLHGTTLPSLKHVAFSGNGNELHNATRGFLNATVQSLESISLQGIATSDALVEAILYRQTDELRSFTQGNHEGSLPISKTQVKRLMEACAKLQTVSINLPRPQNSEMGWDYDTLDLFTKSLFLEHLILRFPSADHEKYKGQYSYTDTITYDNVWTNYKKFGDTGDVPDPHISTTSVETLFSELRARSKNDGCKQNVLKKLEVYVGEWETRREAVLFGGGGWLRVGHWECIVDEEGLEKCVGEQTRNII